MKHFIFKLTQVRYVAFSIFLIFPTVAFGVDVTSFDVSGIKLGMTPDQILKKFKKMNKGYRVSSTPYESSGRKFVGKVFSKRTGSSYKDSDSFSIDFASPPHKNIAVAITRLRIYNLSDSKTLLTFNNVRSSLFKKYGKTANTAPIIKGSQASRLNPKGFYTWGNPPKGCVAGYGDLSRKYIMQNGSVLSVMNTGKKCPATMKIEVVSHPPGVSTIRTFLLDYPTLYKAAIANSKMAREWKANQVRKQKNRGGPNDL